MKPVYKPEIGTNGNWYETTDEWHGSDREFSCDNGTKVVRVGGKGKHWDIHVHEVDGDFTLVQHLIFEDAISQAEDYLNPKNTGTRLTKEQALSLFRP